MCLPSFYTETVWFVNILLAAAKNDFETAHGKFSDAVKGEFEFLYVLGFRCVYACKNA